MTALDQFKEKC